MLEGVAQDRLRLLLAPYVEGLALPEDLYSRCSAYLDLLLRWNARTNLTAIRDPEILTTRQLGESLFAAQLVPEHGTLLDFGSGAGFPGIPLQFMRPTLQVTLAESQGKKASFLREAVRTLSLPAEVCASRVEAMPQDRRYDMVTMRAVDHSAEMFHVAARRVADGGSLLRFVSEADTTTQPRWMVARTLTVPQSSGRLVLLRRT